MKSAYELAMERLDKEKGARHILSNEQKSTIAEVNSRMKARLAEVDIMFAERIGAALSRGDQLEIQALQDKKLQDIAQAKHEAESEKARVRAGHY